MFNSVVFINSFVLMLGVLRLGLLRFLTGILWCVYVAFVVSVLG